MARVGRKERRKDLRWRARRAAGGCLLELVGLDCGSLQAVRRRSCRQMFLCAGNELADLSVALVAISQLVSDQLASAVRLARGPFCVGRLPAFEDNGDGAMGDARRATGDRLARRTRQAAPSLQAATTREPAGNGQAHAHR